MHYFLCYKGKNYGVPMREEDARIKLAQLSYCIKGLKIKPAKGPEGDIRQTS